MEEIDYSKYSLRELYEARSNVNRDVYPRNAEMIDHWIGVREGHSPLEESPKLVASKPAQPKTSAIPPTIEKQQDFQWLQFYFSPKGRITRAEWWLGGLPIGSAIVILEYFLFKKAPIISIFLFVALLYPKFILHIKRSHDRGFYGWFALMLFLPIVFLWPMIELGFIKGNVGKNKFGDDPLQ